MNMPTHSAAIEDDKLNITHQIITASLLAALPDDQQTFSLNQPWASDFTPTPDLSSTLLNTLISQKTISIYESGYKTNTIYQLEIDNSSANLRQLITQVKTAPKEHTTEIMLLIMDLIAAECMEFLAHQLSQQDLALDLSYKPPLELYELLKLNSCSEVHMLIWLALKSISNSDLRIFRAASETSDIVTPIIAQAKQINRNYRYYKKKIKPFRKFKGFSHTALNNILFSQYLGCGTSYYTTSWQV